MKPQVQISPIIKAWQQKVGIDLEEIASHAMALCGKEMNLAYFPVWQYCTASTENPNGMTVFLEPALSFDPHCPKEILIERNSYLTAHEISHPEFHEFQFKEWFRHDLLSEPYLLDS